MLFFSLINFLEFKIHILKLIFLASLIIISYALIQLIGLDPFRWDTINIKMFSTLGNPNFLSAFLACSLVPVLVFGNAKLCSLKAPIKRLLLGIILTSFVLVIYLSRSNQGLVIAFVTTIIFVILYNFKNNNIKLSFLSFIIFVSVSIIGILGTLRVGPLSSILYKSSVTSRGDFFRAAFKMGNDNWIHGVGIDGFGDYYLSYRDVRAANRQNAEYVDSSHNYFLDIYSNLGLMSLCIYILMIILTFKNFIMLIKSVQFDAITVSIFVFWIGVQIQSLISPTNLVFLVYNFAFAGIMLNFSKIKSTQFSLSDSPRSFKNYTSMALGLIIGLAVLSPFVAKDRSLLLAQKGTSLEAVILATESFPQSIVTYNRILTILAKTNEYPEVMLQLAREATRFNERTVPGQFTILVNQKSSTSEKWDAYNMLIKIDPHNSIISEFRP
jgi:O-antigen ligase